MEELNKCGQIGRAALRAGMDRKTARKYLKAGKLPSELRGPRDWRTHVDAFEEHWTEVEQWLRDAPQLEAKTVFEQLMAKFPDRYHHGQLRTLQRRVRMWRAERGPDREVVLAQAHRPGEAAQTDFTSAKELGVTIAGELFPHLLCVFVLPYSNWRWATVCLSESMSAIRRGIQRALFRLGRVPAFHQTDNSTAATHRVPDGKSVVRDELGARPFNEDYVAIMRHFGMEPRTTAVGEKEQNGDVESANGALKRALEQALLVRGSRDFESRDAWQAFVDELNDKANRARGERVARELEAMRVLAVDRMPEFVEHDVRVSEWSTVRVKHCSYSVPSRLVGQWVQVRLFEDRIEVLFAGQRQLECPRLRGRHQHRVDYRHVIWSLLRKPGGFARYVYREDMFPSQVFRVAYDTIHSPHRGTKGDLEYLRILHLAASGMETDVECALSLLLGEEQSVSAAAVKALLEAKGEHTNAPVLERPIVDLSTYDALLAEVGT